MKNALFLLLVSAFVVSSCGKNDDTIASTSLDGECLGVIDFLASPSFRIALVDENGSNLIESGAVTQENFSAELNGMSYPDMPFTALDSITLHSFTTSELQKDYRWLLRLSDKDTDTLDYRVSFEEVRYIDENTLFCGTFVKLVSASYNNVEVIWDTTLVKSTNVIPITAIKKTQ